MTKCYFSNLQAITISELRMAQKNVCIAVAWINFEVYYPIFSELLARGVCVQIIVNDDSNNARYKCQIDISNWITGSNYAIQTKSKQAGLYESKTCHLSGDRLERTGFAASDVFAYSGFYLFQRSAHDFQ